MKHLSKGNTEKASSCKKKVGARKGAVLNPGMVTARAEAGSPWSPPLPPLDSMDPEDIVSLTAILTWQVGQRSPRSSERRAAPAFHLLPSFQKMCLSSIGREMRRPPPSPPPPGSLSAGLGKTFSALISEEIEAILGGGGGGGGANGKLENPADER